MIDYALWEVIENGATLPKTQVVEGVTTVMPITSAEDKAQRRLEVKARSTLMMGIPNEHQLKFNSIKDAKQLLEAVEKRFGRNEATKKTQRNLLKQQYENFIAPSSEMLDQTFDRLQKLMSQLELLDEKLSQEDVNQKLLRNLSPEWNTHVVVWRNKADLDTMSMDDLYNNLKVYEPKVKRMSNSSSSTQNMAFMSFSNNDTSSSNEAVNVAHGVSTTSTQGRKLTVNGNETIGFNKSKVECYNCHKRGHFARDCRAPRNQDNKNRESSRRSVHVETSTSTALVSYDGLGGYDWSDPAKEGPNYALMAFSSSNSDSDVSNDSNYSKSCMETVKLLKAQNDQLLRDLEKSSLMVLGYKTGIMSITVNGKAAYELKGKFLDDLCDNAFSGTNGEDAVEHIEYFLKIVDPISLVGNANPFTREVLRDFWKKVDNKEGVTNKGFPDLEEANNNDEHEIAEIFRIETNLFDYETPMRIEFKEFNWLLKVDTELFTHDIERTKTYEDYENELNNEVDRFCNGGELPGMVQVRYMTYFQDYEWDHIRRPYANYYSNAHEEKEQEDEERCELFDDPAQESPIYEIRRFEMIKYSFGQEEEYVSIKKYEYDDLTRTNKDACHAYQEIFRNMDEGWLVTRAE
ncbi:ribonuclease H-like domain-containing protein [Tanacetum coccineum]